MVSVCYSSALDDIMFCCTIIWCPLLSTLRLRQNSCHFPEHFEMDFLNENVSILIKMSQKFVPKPKISNIPALIQIMAWCRPSDKPLSEPMMVRLQIHICLNEWTPIFIIHQSEPVFYVWLSKVSGSEKKHHRYEIFLSFAKILLSHRYKTWPGQCIMQLSRLPHTCHLFSDSADSDHFRDDVAYKVCIHQHMFWN